jgi:hypothetical protein
MVRSSAPGDIIGDDVQSTRGGRSFNLSAVMALASAASFYAHVFIDKEYHVQGLRLERFAWLRRKRRLHFAHHLHGTATSP